MCKQCALAFVKGLPGCKWHRIGSSNEIAGNFKSLTTEHKYKLLQKSRRSSN